MKACLLVLTLVASLANAGDIGRIKNNAGGAIVFTPEKCANDNGLVAYGYSGKNGDTVFGCFFADNSAIFVKWSEDGSIKRYPFDSITWSPEFLETLKKNRKTY